MTSSYLTIDEHNKSPMPVFTVALIKSHETKNAEYTIKFQFQNHYKEFAGTWQTLDPANYPIHVLSLNGETVSHSNGVFSTASTDFGCVLNMIRLEDGTTFESPENVRHWFPLVEKPAELDDGALRLFHTSEIEDRISIVANIKNNRIPFLDLSGTFHYPARIVSREVDYGEYVSCEKDERATLFSLDGKFKAYLDHTTHLIYEIAYEAQYCQIEKTCEDWEERRI